MPDREVLDRLFSSIYEQLRRLAAGVLKSEYAPELSATTLVHEAWLKFARTPQAAFTSPVEFRRMAARAMRQILVDAARRRQAEIHGGGLIRVTFDPSLGCAQGANDDDLIALNAALELLERRSSRQAQLVEARFFGGLSCVECAELLGVSEATIMREWRAARAWLAVEIRGPFSNATSAGARSPDV